MSNAGHTVQPVSCPSTHGAAGYTLGDYWDGDAIVCCICGKRIENPPPTGQRCVHRASWWRLLIFNEQDRHEPSWPEWITGRRCVMEKLRERGE